MVGVPLRALEADFIEGKRLAESGDRDSVLGAWYLEANAARFRARAELRSRADAALGTRESSDALNLLAAISEPEPTAVEQAGDVRSRSPFLDMVDHPDDYSDKAHDAMKDAQLGLHRAFVLKVNEDGERRRRNAA